MAGPILTKDGQTAGKSVKTFGAQAGGDLVDDTTPQLGGDLDCNGSQIQWSKGADVASGTALAVLTDGNYFDVTGTTTITSINTTGGVGTLIKLHFDGVLTLTHHATNLVLPGNANITTAAGDEAEFMETGAGTYQCTSYQVQATAPGGGGGGTSIVTRIIYIEDPLNTDSFSICFIAEAATMVAVRAITDVGTVDFNIEKRGKLTPDQAGTNIWTADKVATVSGLEQTSFDSGSISADDWLTYAASAVASSPTKLWISVEYTID